MSEQRTVEARPPILWGRQFRYLLTLHLVDAGRPLTVAELVRRVEGDGFAVSGRLSKVVSDALRWEVRRGRVVRLGRGEYGVGRIPRSTLHRMRQRIAQERDRL